MSCYLDCCLRGDAEDALKQVSPGHHRRFQVCHIIVALAAGRGGLVPAHGFALLPAHGQRQDPLAL